MFHLISVIFTIALTALTIIAAFASHVSPATSSIMTFLGLILPLLLLFCIFTSIYWVVRFRFWVFLPLFAILINWSYLSSVIQSPFQTKKVPTTSHSYKIATYNVGRFGKDTSGLMARRVAFYMASEQVDIICFQEFAESSTVTADSISRIFSIWPYTIIPQTEDKASILPLAIYSKYPIIGSKLITFPNTPNCSMWVDIQINERTIRVFNNHLQTTGVNQSRGNLDTGAFLYSVNDIVRAKQAEYVSQLIEESPHPVLVVGDLNSPPSSYTYRTMKSSLKDGFRSAGHGFGYTYRYFKRLLRIDYIFHSPSIKAIDYYSPDLDYGSDHNPVIMEIEL